MSRETWSLMTHKYVSIICKIGVLIIFVAIVKFHLLLVYMHVLFIVLV